MYKNEYFYTSMVTFLIGISIICSAILNVPLLHFNHSVGLYVCTILNIPPGMPLTPMTVGLDYSVCILLYFIEAIFAFNLYEVIERNIYRFFR